MNLIEIISRKDVTVNRMIRGGSTMEEIIAALSTEKEQLVRRVIELDGLRPRRVKLKDGTLMSWNCPDDLIPVEEL